MKLNYWGIISAIAAGGIVSMGNSDRASAATITLYDGTSGVTPDLYNPPAYLGFVNIGTGSQTAAGGVTTLNTSSREGTFAGYSNYALTGGLVNNSLPPLILNNNAGYTLSFTVKINSQTNSGVNGPFRAGFSAIVLGNDKKGIEIGFRNTDIFSQNDANFNSIGERATGVGGILGNLTQYDLTVSRDTYTLSSGGNSIVSGFVRDYSAANTVFGNVYNNPNFIFFGDSTTSAGASVDIARITLTTADSTAVPEPSNLLGIGLAMGVGATLKRKLGKIGRKI
ncbi:PEP-CTERM sorting domain-containing protein [Chamaesiphon sp. GL140_3_metabinner_50]|uniref:PEP-CTERM sorting domain-containing protein n=1 Tax=Chamaesiphon sp. GL140_3_metabinner_50 TaxID=2970812 RepID=UPI0025E5C1F5|nr:PEP-CTERM sorting domain-containing protein [Chamaesiphon sp. GL140_3_metabinner_50]